LPLKRTSAANAKKGAVNAERGAGCRNRRRRGGRVSAEKISGGPFGKKAESREGRLDGWGMGEKQIDLGRAREFLSRRLGFLPSEDA